MGRGDADSVSRESVTSQLWWKVMNVGVEVGFGAQVGGLLLHSFKPPGRQ